MTPERIKLVEARLNLVYELTKSRNNFCGKEKIEHIGKNGWDHPYKNYAALRFYLLLTCFDILGQTDDFIDYYSWLQSKQHSEERQSIINNLVSHDILNQSCEIYENYNKIYGVKNSFKRFVNEILSEQNKQKLLNSIEIKKIHVSENRLIEYVKSDKKKMEFLYLIRNLFTHKGISLASGAGGIFNDVDDDQSIVVENRKGWLSYIIHTESNEKYKYNYSVGRWPSLLVEIIKDTINQ